MFLYSNKPRLGSSTFEKKSNIGLSVYSKSREISTCITLEIVVVAEIGSRTLGICVLFRTRTVLIGLCQLLYLSVFTIKAMSYAGAGVRNLPTTGIPSVDKGFYYTNSTMSI